MVRSPVHLNLLVMFAANVGGATYREALKLIEHTIRFFQSRSVFTPLNTPGWIRGSISLTLEIENLSTTDLSNLWGVMGGRYVPSVLYRVRLIEIDGEELQAQPRRVSRTRTSVSPMRSDAAVRPAPALVR